MGRKTSKQTKPNQESKHYYLPFFFPWDYMSPTAKDRFEMNTNYSLTVTTFILQYYAVSVTIFGPRQANLVLITYASSEGSGEPAHLCSLARTSAARSYKQ